MASFTMRLKDAIEITGGSLNIVNGVSRMTGGNIGLGYYPIFDEAHRPILTGKIIDHYMMEEIGVESIDMFQLVMRRKMNEIMPPYNDMYRSQLLKFDPLQNISLSTLSKAVGEQSVNETSEQAGTTSNDQTTGNKTSQNSTSSGEAESASDNVSQGRVVSSETPQTMLNGSEDYATSASDSNSKATVASNSNESATATTETDQAGNTTDRGSAQSSGSQESNAVSSQDTETSTTGLQGSPFDILLKLRATIINVDQMIIDDLQECFMTIRSNGRNMGERRYL
jgi:hypothetical protein